MHMRTGLEKWIGAPAGISCTRRRLFLAALIALVLAAPAQAQRGPYPAAPVRVIVGFPPGGGVDVVARLLAQQMTPLLGQPVVVENRPGAGSSIGTRLVAAAAPDGHTVLINSNSIVVNQVANPNAGYDIERQLIPVLNAAWQPTVVVASTTLPANSLAEVIALSRTRKLSFGTPGQASIPHLAAAYLFDLLAKTESVNVPYNGAAPALAAVVGGQIDLAFVTLPPAVPQVKSGKVKGIAVTSAKRTSALPDLPTVAESGFPGYEVNAFTGFFMPAGTPKAVTDRFREAVLKVLAMPDVQGRLTGLGFELADTANEDFPRIVSDELKQWAKVVKATNIKIE
jgi:tripartite-type tricarboxylate transporter receptor subunit TctC